MFLLDTPVLSESSKRRPDPAVTEWLNAQDPSSVFLSILTFGEIQKGVSKREEGLERERLASWIEAALEEFAEQILAIDLETALLWGEISGTAQRRGRTVPVVDSLIAATALRHRLTVATRNVDDFVACGVPVLNPWDPS